MTDQSIARSTRLASLIGVAVAVGFSSAALGAGAGAPASAGIPATQDTVSFANDILPIFQNRCAKCHGAPDEDGEPRLESGLNLLEYEKVIAGSEWGTVVEAGDPANSFLLDMIVDQTMPEEGDPVPEDEIALIRAWIEAGAPNN